MGTRCKRLSFEMLESRQLLAADLEIVSVDFTNAIGELTGSTPTVGEKVYTRVHYRMTDLTPADFYDISWEMDGVKTEQFGFQGFAGTNVDLFWFHGGWIAQAGASHVITVTVDSNDGVTESNEGNNSITLSPFTPLAPTSLPNKFITPLAGTQNTDWVLGGYVDVNPKFFADDPVDFFQDFQGNTTTTRDFHNGLDFPITNFAAQDAGVQVLAAAAGTVMEVRDGFFDRETFLQFGDPGNFVFVDHGNGWVSQYYHLRRDSITVAVNDVVTAGQVIGLVGSSGNSAGPHLHFEIQHNKSPVDPFAAPNDYFVSPLPYVIDPVLPNNLLDFGVTNDFVDGAQTFFGPSFEQVLEKVSDIDTFPTTGQEIYAWAIFSSVEAGDTWRAQLYRPNGSLVVDFGNVMFTQPTDFQDDGDTDGFDFLAWQRNAGTTSGASKSDGDANFSGSVDDTDLALWELQYGKTAINGWEWGWYRPGFTEAIAGTWRVDFLFNDVKVGEQTFEVGSSLPEIRVFENTAGTYIIDDRTTPFDLGSVVQGQPGPTMTFKVENHGYGDLSVSNVQVPTGFTVTEALSATIPAGTSDTFTLRLDSVATGNKSGQIVINSNDSSEAGFTFAVEGTVTGPLSALASQGDVPAGPEFFFDDALLAKNAEEPQTFVFPDEPVEAATVETTVRAIPLDSAYESTDRARVRQFRDVRTADGDAIDSVFERIGSRFWESV